MRCRGAQGRYHCLGVCSDTNQEARLLGTLGAGASRLKPPCLSRAAVYPQRVRPLKMLVFLLGFPDASVGKEFACTAGGPGLIPELGRSAGDLPDPGYLLQYSGLEYFSRLLTYF